jgi:cell division protein FtsB
MIALAVNAAEEQLMNGTASSQVITHYLKLGSTKTRLENEKLQAENDLLKAKIEALNSQKRTEELYAEALKAMRDYSGNGGDDYV